MLVTIINERKYKCHLKFIAFILFGIGHVKFCSEFPNSKLLKKIVPLLDFLVSN